MKKIPQSQESGREQVFYEVSTSLSSGSDWVTKTSNSNRLHLTDYMPLSRKSVIYSNQFICKAGDYFRVGSVMLYIYMHNTNCCRPLSIEENVAS